MKRFGQRAARREGKKGERFGLAIEKEALRSGGQEGNDAGAEALQPWDWRKTTKRCGLK